MKFITFLSFQRNYWLIYFGEKNPTLSSSKPVDIKVKANLRKPKTKKRRKKKKDQSSPKTKHTMQSLIQC